MVPVEHLPPGAGPHKYLVRLGGLNANLAESGARRTFYLAWNRSKYSSKAKPLRVGRKQYS